MAIKPLLLTLVAACGVTAGAAADPDKQPPPTPPEEEGQHFCCQSVNLDKKSGDDCQPIGPGQIVLCNEVLYCAGDWGKSNGTTRCLD